MWRPGAGSPPVGWEVWSGVEGPFDGGGVASRQPGLPRSAGIRSLPGDMMMDWVSPRLRGDAAAHSLEAVRVPCAAGRRPDSPLAGAGRVIPIG